MSRIYDQEGDRFQYKNETGQDIAVDTPIVIGGIDGVGGVLGIPQTDIPNGETGTCLVTKAHFLPKKAAEVMPQGQKVYWHKDTKEVCLAPDGTKTIVAGIVCVAASGADAKVSVVINARSS